MTLILRNDSISSGEKPSSDKTSAVCSPSAGALQRNSDGLALRCKGVLAIKSALTALCYGSAITVSAAFATFDANHIRAKIGEQHGAIGRGNEAPEVNDSNAS